MGRRHLSLWRLAFRLGLLVGTIDASTPRPQSRVASKLSNNRHQTPGPQSRPVGPPPSGGGYSTPAPRDAPLRQRAESSRPASISGNKRRMPSEPADPQRDVKRTSSRAQNLMAPFEIEMYVLGPSSRYAKEPFICRVERNTVSVLPIGQLTSLCDPNGVRKWKWYLPVDRRQLSDDEPAGLLLEHMANPERTAVQMWEWLDGEITFFFSRINQHILTTPETIAFDFDSVHTLTSVWLRKYPSSRLEARHLDIAVARLPRPDVVLVAVSQGDSEQPIFLPELRYRIGDSLAIRLSERGALRLDEQNVKEFDCGHWADMREWVLGPVLHCNCDRRIQEICDSIDCGLPLMGEVKKYMCGHAIHAEHAVPGKHRCPVCRELHVNVTLPDGELTTYDATNTKHSAKNDINHQIHDHFMRLDITGSMQRVYACYSIDSAGQRQRMPRFYPRDTLHDRPDPIWLEYQNGLSIQLIFYGPFGVKEENTTEIVIVDSSHRFQDLQRLAGRTLSSPDVFCRQNNFGNYSICFPQSNDTLFHIFEDKNNPIFEIIAYTPVTVTIDGQAIQCQVHVEQNDVESNFRWALTKCVNDENLTKSAKNWRTTYTLRNGNVWSDFPVSELRFRPQQLAQLAFTQLKNKANPKSCTIIFTFVLDGGRRTSCSVNLWIGQTTLAGVLMKARHDCPELRPIAFGGGWACQPDGSDVIRPLPKIVEQIRDVKDCTMFIYQSPQAN